MSIIESIQERFSNATNAFIAEFEKLKSPDQNIVLPPQFLTEKRVDRLAGFLIDKTELSLIKIYNGTNKFMIDQSSGKINLNDNGAMMVKTGDNCFSIDGSDYYTNEDVSISERVYLVKIIPNEKRVEIVRDD
jgi:hypothetical protein